MACVLDGARQRGSGTDRSTARNATTVYTGGMPTLIMTITTGRTHFGSPLPRCDRDSVIRMSSSEVTNHELLAGAAYGDDRRLAARHALYHWQSPRYDLSATVVGELADTTGPVIDVGCGNGKFIRRPRTERPDRRAIGLDTSAGIPPQRRAARDGRRRPTPAFGDEIADAVLAMHMLYHVEDIDAGIAEIRRVLCPAGIAVASTKSEHDKVELDQLWSRAAADVLGVEQGPRRISLSNRFCPEAAPRMLRRLFAYVRTLELPGVIELTGPEPDHRPSRVVPGQGRPDGRTVHRHPPPRRRDRDQTHPRNRSIPDHLPRWHPRMPRPPMT
jgi:SAM-dependent methyltransferase